ncbi:MAG TPA: antibiotic biosynthesis monooxygenase family protein [Vicinamibacterales bacterium]|nr:antibiotic biosynthesis monooxygenase family protein [Vicinamibacterales bacterium]
MIAVVWQFQVKPGKQHEFETFYGADGKWSSLARRSRSFLGSSFLRDQANDTSYLLVEYWSEMVVYERYRKNVVSDMRTLEERRENLCDAIVPVGVFSALDVPDRDGLTWSRRDGV